MTRTSASTSRWTLADRRVRTRVAALQTDADDEMQALVSGFRV